VLDSRKRSTKVVFADLLKLAVRNWYRLISRHMKFNGAGSSLLDLHELRATRLSFDVKFEMEPSAHMVVTDKFEIRTCAMRIVAWTSFLAPNVRLYEVQRGLSHTTLHGLTSARRFPQTKRRQARVSIMTVGKHSAGDSDISWQNT
jgi:hypothetical protein